METKKLEVCKTKNVAEKWGGSTVGKEMFWCKHSDRCKSQIHFGNDKICTQSPLYVKPKVEDQRKADDIIY